MPGQGNLPAGVAFSSEIVGHGDTLGITIGNLPRGVGRAEEKIGVAWAHDLCVACSPVHLPTDFSNDVWDGHSLYSVNARLTCGIL